MVHVNTGIDKVDIKKDAWLIKGFAVLVKRNYMKGRVKSNDKHFLMLLRLLAGEDSEEARRRLKGCLMSAVEVPYIGFK